MGVKRLSGILKVPGDKSISHRALVFSVLSRGKCRVSGLSPARDCLNTADCLQKLGLAFERSSADCLEIVSPGVFALSAPSTTLDAGNSGTTMRLLAGVLSGQPFEAVLDGDASLRTRPMARLLTPLSEMGSEIAYLRQQNFAPFKIKGARLTGKEFHLQVPSAQVQTALLLAGLQAQGETLVHLPAAVRDHTMSMFSLMGVPFSYVDTNRNSVSLLALDEPVAPFVVSVPGDLSSAAFFMVAAACLPGSDITLVDVGLNPGRDLVIEVLKEMGADVEVTLTGLACGESVGSIRVKGQARLRGAVIAADRLARGVDEIPALALAGALCDGVFKVEDGAELRVKETDRIDAIVSNLKAAGAQVQELADGFAIDGQSTLPGGSLWTSRADHRMAMSGQIASLIAQRPMQVDNLNCVSVSYPAFGDELQRLLLD